MKDYHVPVLLKDCIDALGVSEKPNGVYVDVTFGGGGHSEEILKYLKKGKLYAFDCDEDAALNRIKDKRFKLIQKNFSELKTALLKEKITGIDGLLADLGVSSHQFDSAERGFSIRFDTELDMRMNKSSEGVTASDILRSYSENDLRRVFSEYGELHNALHIAKVIVKNRLHRNITVNEFKNMIAICVDKRKENQFYAKVFQALRIEANNELSNLKELLLQSKDVLKAGGKMAVISYHSLEDRLVKNFFRSGKFEGDIEKDMYGNSLSPFKVITRQPIVPGENEIEHNNRARSAKLRVAERTIN